MLSPDEYLPYYFNISGVVACLVMLIMSIFYLFYAVNLYLECNDKAARKLMFASFAYLPIVLLILVVDKI